MGKGGYIGGSTVTRSFPPRSRPRTKGLLSLEVELERTGKVSPRSIAANLQKTPDKKAKVKRRKVVAAAAPPAPAELKPKPNIAPAAAGRSIPVPCPAAAAAQYSADAVRRYLARHHPACPEPEHKRIARLASQGRWSGMGMAEVVASCMENYLTYDVCGLQKLIAAGHKREAALEMIAPQVRATLGLWGAKPVWLKATK